MKEQLREFVRKGTVGCDLWFQIAGGNTVVAIKLDIIEDCGDAMPARHSSGFGSAYTRHRDSNDIAKSQGFADQNDFKLDGGANGKLPGAKKMDSGGADVASNKRYGKFLGHSACTAKTQREVQAGAGVFALLWVHAYGMRRHAHETPTLVRAQKWRQAQRRKARRIWNQLRPSRGPASCFGRFA
jgi:hypothetical protein